MPKAFYEFENGYVIPICRGVVLWNGNEDDIGPVNPRREFDDLVYELIGAKDAWSFGYDLKGIKVSIEIQEVAKR